jgi:hypothetical protein
MIALSLLGLFVFSSELEKPTDLEIAAERTTPDPSEVSSASASADLPIPLESDPSVKEYYACKDMSDILQLSSENLQDIKKIKVLFRSSDDEEVVTVFDHLAELGLIRIYPDQLQSPISVTFLVSHTDAFDFLVSKSGTEFNEAIRNGLKIEVHSVPIKAYAEIATLMKDIRVPVKSFVFPSSNYVEHSLTPQGDLGVELFMKSEDMDFRKDLSSDDSEPIDTEGFCCGAHFSIDGVELEDWPRSLNKFEFLKSLSIKMNSVIDQDFRSPCPKSHPRCWSKAFKPLFTALGKLEKLEKFVFVGNFNFGESEIADILVSLDPKITSTFDIDVKLITDSVKYIDETGRSLDSLDGIGRYRIKLTKFK